MPQDRQRLYLVGCRRDVSELNKFRFPSKGIQKPKDIESLLPPAKQHSAITDRKLNFTERRNWELIQQEMETKDAKFPVIADFHQSTAFGTSWHSHYCPTITKTRAKGRAFWLIDKRGGDLCKRRLDVEDYAALQGWDRFGQKDYLRIGSKDFMRKAKMLEALGNGFSVTVFQAIFYKYLKCFNGSSGPRIR